MRFILQLDNYCELNRLCISQPKQRAASESDCEPDLDAPSRKNIWPANMDWGRQYDKLPFTSFFWAPACTGWEHRDHKRFPWPGNGSSIQYDDGEECLTRPLFSIFNSALQHAPGGSTDVVIDFQSGKDECLTQLSFSAFCSGLWHVLGGNDFCGRVKIAILVLPLGNNVLNSITREWDPTGWNCNNLVFNTKDYITAVIAYWL